MRAGGRPPRHRTRGTRAIHLLAGITANERMDWLVEKATELGVASITPLVAERSVLKLKGERADKARPLAGRGRGRVRKVMRAQPRARGARCGGFGGLGAPTRSRLQTLQPPRACCCRCAKARAPAAGRGRGGPGGSSRALKAA